MKIRDHEYSQFLYSTWSFKLSDDHQNLNNSIKLSKQHILLLSDVRSGQPQLSIVLLSCRG